MATNTITGTPPTAIVTGASKGLGRALAGALVARGWHVIIDARDEAALREAATSTGAVPVAGDVNDPNHRAALIERAQQVGGRLDLLVNNAGTLGTSPPPTLRHYDLGALRQVFEANVIAPLGLTQLALPLLAVSNGAIVNITSDAALEAYEGWGGYGASKAALEQLSNVLSIEEGAIEVWWLDPGDMRTDMHQAAFPGQDISDRPEPASVVPALLWLLEHRPPSGRARAADLLAGAPR